jgi:hypothetical protein
LVFTVNYLTLYCELLKVVVAFFPSGRLVRFEMTASTLGESASNAGDCHSRASRSHAGIQGKLIIQGLGRLHRQEGNL